ncbi:MAG: polyprenyl synthetase family protein [Thermoanaerobacteraceae bacterium]|nr:polyprenyl synthetase family protein [Thermoanaerobacteraceae bacterium]
MIQLAYKINNDIKDTHSVLQITQGMTAVEEELIHIINQSDIIVRDMIKNLFNAGKRIRPRLVLLSGMCFNELNKKMIYSAVSAELIHTASLVHDDIIDMSDFRRNSPTINYVYGNHTAVLAGDFLFAHAFEALSSYNLTRSMSYLVKAIQEMCVGEIMQVHRRFDTSTTERDYIDYIGMKTASLISACCKAGAENAGADNESIELMGYFGYNIGCAFQIIDDILDITGNRKELGKPAAHDIIEGDISLPFIYLFEDKKYANKYGDVLLNRQVNSHVRESIIHDVQNSDAILKSRHKAEEFVNQAIRALLSLPHTIYRDILVEMSIDIIGRHY